MNAIVFEGENNIVRLQRKERRKTVKVQILVYISRVGLCSKQNGSLFKWLNLKGARRYDENRLRMRIIGEMAASDVAHRADILIRHMRIYVRILVLCLRTDSCFLSNDLRRKQLQGENSIAFVKHLIHCHFSFNFVPVALC